ncbi:hypothetical protein HDA40_000802 [Hamadaea flava]|uniref:DUF6245 family protein n=1 Tax=Hamadaea flava TaxID=1742688 RepID=A0ABV8LRC1_9ACTN|nr:DUF6245 family protein [Hamadaea flava]MCP2322295.1 hypothetical protein [Hamadaea flava]
MESDGRADGERPLEQRLVGALNMLGVDHVPREAADQTAAMDELGGVNAYRAWLASALLGASQSLAMATDRLPLSRDARYAIWQRQLSAADVASDPAARAELIRWQVQRACAPLPAIAQECPADPIPLAAGQAAEGLKILLAVSATTYGAVAAGDVHTLADQAGKLREARKILQAAIENTDLLLDLLGSVDL